MKFSSEWKSSRRMDKQHHGNDTTLAQLQFLLLLSYTSLRVK